MKARKFAYDVAVGVVATGVTAAFGVVGTRWNYAYENVSRAQATNVMPAGVPTWVLVVFAAAMWTGLLITFVGTSILGLFALVTWLVDPDRDVLMVAGIWIGGALIVYLLDLPSDAWHGLAGLIREPGA